MRMLDISRLELLQGWSNLELVEVEVVPSILVEVDSSETSSHALSRPEFVIHLPLIFHGQASRLPAFSSGYNQRIEYQ